MKASTPKGFRDYLPTDSLKRQFVINKIIQVFQKFGFQPLETPTLEFEETLTGKYGEEERLIYKFQTMGGDKVALKYDQTVPLARVVAQYGSTGEQKIQIPFKRYQIQPAYRGESPQKGRYREFLQCDADIVGPSNPLVDAEILAVIYEVYKNLGLEVVIKVNDRSLLTEIEPKYLSVLDKLNKIGKEGVLRELALKGLSESEADKLFEKVTSFEPTDNLKETLRLYIKMGYPEDSIKFEPTLVRGLDYYTGIIMETVLKDSESLSLGGGGRYDKMIGKFSGVDLGACGFSVGLERTIEAMEELGKLESIPQTKVLVTVFSKELEEKSLEVTSKLRLNNVSSELWLEPDSKLEKQLKYADQKGIPYVVIIGPEEAENDQIKVKTMSNQDQETISLDELIQKLTS